MYQNLVLPITLSNETVSRPTTRQPHPMGTASKTEDERKCLIPITFRRCCGRLKIICKFPGQFIGQQFSNKKYIT